MEKIKNVQEPRQSTNVQIKGTQVIVTLSTYQTIRVYSNTQDETLTKKTPRLHKQITKTYKENWLRQKPLHAQGRKPKCAEKEGKCYCCILKKTKMQLMFKLHQPTLEENMYPI